MFYNLYHKTEWEIYINKDLIALMWNIDWKVCLFTLQEFDSAVLCAYNFRIYIGEKQCEEKKGAVFSKSNANGFHWHWVLS